MPVKNQAHFIDPKRTAKVFKNKIDALGFFLMFPPIRPGEMTRFEKMARVGFIPLVDKFTVPDDMPVRFFSSRSIIDPAL